MFSVADNDRRTISSVDRDRHCFRQARSTGSSDRYLYEMDKLSKVDCCVPVHASFGIVTSSSCTFSHLRAIGFGLP